MANANELHVVLGGTGGVGSAVVRELVQQGKRVRAVSRTGTGELPAGAEALVADASTAEGARAACAGAAVVYCCTNPPYDKWAQRFPALVDAAIAGAAAAGAKLVMADNLYVYSPTTQPLTEDLPQQPGTRKGNVRVALDATLLAAHRSGTVRVALGRAADYYGPAAPSSGTGAMFFGQVLAGKAVQWPGRIDVPHILNYTNDFARGLIVLGERDEALGQAWHIPAAEALTAQQFVALAAEVAGRRARAVAVSPLMMRLVGLFVTPIRETIEMSYEFTQPFVMDGGKFTRAFGFTPTPHRAALEATLAWYRAHAAKK
ncbi:MAG: NAD(P)H-binding protein [Ktedonobacterales bacterium]|nr:NAD(P)H-binding protein [Ktedonobacterales bacterium]